MNPYDDVIAQYAAFAEDCVGSSECFTSWALGVAGDPDVVAWVETLPGIKRQPNLVFAAARWHGVPAPGPYGGLRDALLEDDGSIRSTILSRSTQTNEIGRLATLLPAFALAVPDGPVALLEVGASAGLNLFPDRWGYAWEAADGVRTLGPEPRLRCAVSGPAPVPSSLPDVAWRGGLDLHPLDVRDDDAMAWLETLVWPEQDERRRRLRHAVSIARADPPRLVTGDLLEAVPDLVTEAASSGTVVVFHSAVLAYVDRPGRERFGALMAGLVADGACHWVSNEGPGVVTGLAGLPALNDPPYPPATFALAVDGLVVAQAQGHGRALHWLRSSDR